MTTSMSQQTSESQRVVALARIVILVAFLLPCVDSATGQSGNATIRDGGDQSIAILIGVQDYGVLGKLQYCQADVDLLATTLKDHCGFDQVVVMTESSPEQLQPTLDNLTRELRRQLQMANDGGFVRVLVYFSGHGYRDSQGRAFLSPSLRRGNA